MGSKPEGRAARDDGISSPVDCCFGGWGEVGCAFRGSIPVDSLAAARVGLSLAITQEGTGGRRMTFYYDVHVVYVV